MNNFADITKYIAWSLLHFETALYYLPKMQEKTQIISSESVSQLNGHGKKYSDDAYVF